MTALDGNEELIHIPTTQMICQIPGILSETLIMNMIENHHILINILQSSDRLQLHDIRPAPEVPQNFNFPLHLDVDH